MDLTAGSKERSLKHTKLPKESPWKRGRDEHVLRPESRLKVTVNTLDEKFEKYKYENIDLDIATKRAALKASASVVGLISRPRAGGEALFKASGTIYDTRENGDGRFLSTIVTSASLFGSTHEVDDIKVEVYIAGGRMFDGDIVGCDAHYNLAIINILPDVQLPVATLRLLDDSVSIDPALAHSSRDNVQLWPHSREFKICAGEMVVALGRNSNDFNIMVAPGKFSLDYCKYDCMELMMATCRITKVEVYIAGGRMLDGDIVGCDAHYNLAIINILPDVRLPVARLRLLDDSVSIDPALAHSSRDNVQLRPHSREFKICTGEMVVALGRNSNDFNIMVAPGQFR